MQYGNKVADAYCRLDIVRLNRTMQYGNEDIQELIDDSEIRLNRTMQYGNCREIFQKINDIGQV